MEKDTKGVVASILGYSVGKFFVGIWFGAGAAFGWWLIGHFFGIFG